jgi:hypothetical protein
MFGNTIKYTTMKRKILAVAMGLMMITGALSAQEYKLAKKHRPIGDSRSK